MQNRLNERDWNRLLREIDRGNVVLVLGDELSRVRVGGTERRLRDYLLTQMLEALSLTDVEAADFSMVSYDYKRAEWQRIHSEPYSEARYILDDLPQSCYETETLEKLLSIDKFRLVLTTAFDDISLRVMQRLRGKDNVASYIYERNSCGQDIPANPEGSIHYRVFGKAEAAPHSFVLTEDDLLEFIHCWMDQNRRPDNLANTLSRKYLLVIGCDYPNWLFRFFFHSLKFSSALPTAKVAGADSGLLADNNLEPELVSFLQRMDARAHEDAVMFIDELSRRWSEYKERNSEAPREETRRSDNAEAFISYASEDYDKARRIAETFMSQGLTVWFDKKDLVGGDEYEKLIKSRIKRAKHFIPILSPATAKTANARFFRKEWSWASDANSEHFGLDDGYIQPLLIDGYQMEENHPFAQFHSIDMTNEEEWPMKIKRMVRNMRLRGNN